MLKLRSVVAVVALTMGGTAVADIINVGPGDSIQAAIVPHSGRRSSDV